jgi:hypothetical protein
MENATPTTASERKSRIGLTVAVGVGIIAIIGIILGVTIARSKPDPVIGNYEAYATIKDGEEETTTYISLMKAFGVTMTIEFKEDHTGEMITTTDPSFLSTGTEEGETSTTVNKEVASFKWKDGKITDMKGKDSEEGKEGTYEYVVEEEGDDKKKVDYVLIKIPGEEGKNEIVKFRRATTETKK